MKKIWTIAWKDFRIYFTSPLAYVAIAAFLFIMGWMFFNNLSYFNLQNLQYQQFNMGKGVSIAEGIVRPLFGNMNVVLLFILPFVTMRLFAEERKSQTIQLLMTSPLSIGQMVMGKFLSSLMLVAVMVALTIVYPVVLMLTGSPDMGPIFTCYVGTLLVASCYLSVGVWCSSMTENQIVAGLLTWAILLFFWLVSWGAQGAGPVLGEVLNYLSIIQHFNNSSQGLLDSSDIFFFLSFTGMGLFLSYRVLDSYRWR